ncbi:hypothetical protein NDU88_002343 [Pleurodeles waltl]|uniref:Uncharacterized protein n=1 Tax=Pleurodeles waltl TaxID=8319 RepID=A0AAV7WPW8_PLEWA|nr:hypothetical protein NDU88_002343 [Pleurodeles waltl]
MRAYSRLIMGQPKAKGSGWKEYKTTVLHCGSMPKVPDYASALPLLVYDSREADFGLPNRLIFYHKVGEKVDKAFSLQQITEQITEQNNEQTSKQIESELQLEKQDVALAQEPEQEPALTALRTEDVGGESYGRCSERGSETRAAENVEIDSAGSSMIVQVDGQAYRKPCHMLKEQQSASESPRMESEFRGQQRREGQEPLLELLYHG